MVLCCGKVPGIIYTLGSTWQAKCILSTLWLWYIYLNIFSIIQSIWDKYFNNCLCWNSMWNKSKKATGLCPLLLTRGDKQLDFCVSVWHVYNMLNDELSVINEITQWITFTITYVKLSSSISWIMPTYLFIVATPLSMKTLCSAYWDHELHAIMDDPYTLTFWPGHF